MRAKSEIFEGEDGQFYFRLIAANGEVVAVSEGYTTKSSAVRGVADLKAMLAPAPVAEADGNAAS